MQLGGAGGNNGRPVRPPCFLFRCQEEPCRCRLGPSGLPWFSIARFSGLYAATAPCLGLGSCRVSPLGRLRRGARLAGDDAKTRGPRGPGGSRAFDGEGPPGTRRPRDLMSRPSGSWVPTSCQTWTGVGRERATSPTSRRHDRLEAGSLRLIPDSLCSLNPKEQLVWHPLPHAPLPVSQPLISNKNGSGGDPNPYRKVWPLMILCDRVLAVRITHSLNDYPGQKVPWDE